MNNEIHDFSIDRRTYTPAVDINGCGDTVSHNEIYNSPHMAIGIHGISFTIEYNDIYNVCNDTADSGAIYSGQRVHLVDNKITNNYFHDIKNNIGMGYAVNAVYFDDLWSSGEVSKNIFFNVERGVLVGGGRSNDINNNLFINSDESVKIDARGNSIKFEDHRAYVIWIIGLYEQYMVYGDVKFLERIYEMATEMIAFVETRINKDGFIEGNEDDWTFIDWAEIDMTGAVCAEQMLLIRAYQVMGNIAETLGKECNSFYEKSEELKKLVNKYYWKEDLGAFIDSYESGKNNVTRHANIFAIMYDIASDEQKEKIIENVLENDNVPQITTPYFKGYELDVMGKVNGLSKIEFLLDSYWGEMIRRGSKTIWEEFDANQKGIERYGMYGGKYAKSLCHAWGAGPIYIFGRYYLGVYPTTPGFETFNVEPNLGGLNEIEGVVPVGDGSVEISLNHNKLTVKASKPGGTLIWKGKEYEIVPYREIIVEE